MWHDLAPIHDCPPGTACEYVAGERIVALFNVEGELFAIDGVCPHQGGPLGQGRLTGCLVTCPWHGWQFDVRDGQHRTNKNYRHPTFRVRVTGERIEVEIPEESQL